MTTLLKSVLGRGRCTGCEQSTYPSSQRSTCLASQQGGCLGPQQGACLASQQHSPNMILARS